MISMIIAFSMFTKIPMPFFEWEEKNMKYVLAFLPLVGFVIGFITTRVGILFRMYNVLESAFGCIMVTIPVFLTGGIHLDGFLDTLDGIGSYAGRRRRLEIMSDPHMGAFSLIGGLVYFTLSIGFWSAFSVSVELPVLLSYIVSRSLAGISILCFPKAKETGLAAKFSFMTSKKIVILILAACVSVSHIIMLFFDLYMGLLFTAATALCFIYFYYICKKKFGGITGDLAGFFIQVYELIILIVSISYSECVIWGEWKLWY